MKDAVVEGYGTGFALGQEPHAQREGLSFRGLQEECAGEEGAQPD